jgi:hypothetical protein
MHEPNLKHQLFFDAKDKKIVRAKKDIFPFISKSFKLQIGRNFWMYVEKNLGCFQQFFLA